MNERLVSQYILIFVKLLPINILTVLKLLNKKSNLLFFFMQNLPIKELTPSQSQERSTLTFNQLKTRLMNLLNNALQVESDPQNTQMLLGKSDSKTFLTNKSLNAVGSLLTGLFLTGLHH